MPLDDPTATKPEIAREIMTDFPVLPRCNYIAGLSAGGAAAAIMGSTYPGSLRRNRRAFRIGVGGLIRSSVSFYGYAQRTAAGLQHRDRAQNVNPTIVVAVDTVITVKGFFDWALGERLPLA